MSDIPILLKAATKEARLNVRYKNSIEILTFDAAGPWRGMHSVKIDHLMLDFDENRILMSVELGLPMKAWRGKSALVWPFGEPGNILLDDELSGHTDLDLPVFVSKNVQKDIGRIDFGNDPNETVALLDSVFALLRDGYLTGFYFNFGSRSKKRVES